MSEDLKLKNYDYTLPAEFIAQRPLDVRHDSKLLVYNKKTDEVIHTTFKEVHNHLPKDALLVFNQTKVFPCRLLGQKSTGGKVEVFVLSLTPYEGTYNCLVKTTNKKHIGDIYTFSDQFKGEIKKVYADGTFGISFNHDDIQVLLEELGRVPIPPYIRDGASDDQDKKQYQTVYAKDEGSVAAPTAGFHFTEDVFKKIESQGIDRAFVTLHVGLGTFRPVKDETITDHKMHSEEFYVTKENLKKINAGKKIFPVGTTSLRVLESIYSEGQFHIEPDALCCTDIFLYPGKKVESVSGMITNFHLPKSSLLMLVASLIGREKVLELYEEAKKEGYRFFSYGDAMLILL